MTLEQRLKHWEGGGQFTNNQVSSLLAGARGVLEALKADLEENESYATETIYALETSLGTMPLDMAAVKDLDHRRQQADAQLQNAP